MQLILLNFNAAVCAAMTLRLLWWRMKHHPPHIIASVVLFIIISSCAAITIRIITGEYYYTDWSEASINAALCMIVFIRHGDLFGKIYDDNQ